MLNQLALSTMFVCSVSTLMFNANPLMRYDGYYILSDLTEIPNLRQKASTILQPQAGQVVPGAEGARRPVFARAESGVLRDLLGGVGHLHVGGHVFDSVFPVQGFRAVSAADHRANAGGVVAGEPGRHAALQARPFLLFAWEGRSSEEASTVSPRWACWPWSRRRSCSSRCRIASSCPLEIKRVAMPERCMWSWRGTWPRCT